MSIRRGKRPDSRFYTLNKDISEDGRLSWAARGLLIFLLGKPDNWTVSVAHLMKQTENSARPSSRDAVRSIINELILAGYMRADTAREGGKFKGVDYVVSESPETDYPAPAKPHSPETDYPSPEKPAPADHPLTNNDLKQELKNPPKTDLVAPQKCAANGGVSASSVIPNHNHDSAKQEQQDEKAAFQEKCRTAWKSYKAAYIQKYGVAPLRDPKVNAQVKQLVGRLGEAAGQVAEFYVLFVKEQRVVQSCHDIGFLLQGAQSYHTQWKSGHTMTSGQARQIDSTATNANAAEQAKAMLRAQHARKKEGGGS